jgi:preprotein translocase subunit SecE
MEKTINKIMMVSFVCAAFLVGYTVQVLNTLLSSSWGAYARVTGSDLITHGAPVFFGLAFFFYVSFSKNIRSWAQEVVVEVSKVVWPSQKDTTAMTIVVCFFMILTGVILGLFDFFSSQVIQFIIEIS